MEICSCFQLRKQNCRRPGRNGSIGFPMSNQTSCHSDRIGKVLLRHIQLISKTTDFFRRVGRNWHLAHAPMLPNNLFPSTLSNCGAQVPPGPNQQPSPADAMPNGQRNLAPTRPNFLSRPDFVRGTPIALLIFALTAEIPSARFRDGLANPNFPITHPSTFDTGLPIQRHKRPSSPEARLHPRGPAQNPNRGKYQRRDLNPHSLNGNWILNPMTRQEKPGHRAPRSATIPPP